MSFEEQTRNYWYEKFKTALCDGEDEMANFFYGIYQAWNRRTRISAYLNELWAEKVGQEIQHGK